VPKTRGLCYVWVMASKPVTPEGPVAYYAGTTRSNWPTAEGKWSDEGLLQSYYSDGPEAAESARLLDELLAAFGLAAERERIDAAGLASKARNGAWRGLPDEAGSAETIVRERVKVLPVLRELVEQLRALRVGPLPSAEHFATVRASVPECWNAELERLGSVTLPRLCIACGVPVLEVANELLAGGYGKPVNTCGEACHAKAENRRKYQARKLKPARD
jgi:ferredoxin